MNDQKKTILLLMLILGIFGVVGWRVAGVPNQVTPPSGPAQTSLDGNQPAAGGSTTITLGAGSGSAAGQAGGRGKPIAVPAPSTFAGPDPFRTAVSNSPAVNSQPIARAPRVSHPSTTIRNSDLDQPISPLKGDILPAPGGGAVDIRPDPAQSLKVSGVLTGDHPIAILRIGDQQVLVHVGDSFGDGYVLKSVSTTQVVVTQGKKTIYLPTMGG